MCAAVAAASGGLRRHQGAPGIASHGVPGPWVGWVEGMEVYSVYAYIRGELTLHFGSYLCRQNLVADLHYGHAGLGALLNLCGVSRGKGEGEVLHIKRVVSPYFANITFLNQASCSCASLGMAGVT